MTSRQLPFQNSAAGQQAPNTRELADIIAAALAAAPQKTDPAIPAKQFFGHGEAWLIDCEMRQLSPRLIELRRLILSKFRWWIEQQKPDGLTLAEHLTETGVNKAAIRQFLHYVTTGHTQPGGRWGNPRNNRPVKPATVVLYHNHLRALCYWIVEEGNLPSSPMETIAAPINRADEVQPFTHAQIDALLEQARRTKHAARDQAICYLLLDTGMRVSELCALRYKDIDLQSYQIGVEGKGGKKRCVAFGTYTRKALWNYLRERKPEPDDCVFLAEGGHAVGEPLTRNGALQMIRRLGKMASIEQARCSPHTFRHTFAIEFLRNGGNQFTLMAILGHTNVKQTNIYVTIAQADVSAQHRMYSPVNAMRRRKG